MIAYVWEVREFVAVAASVWAAVCVAAGAVFGRRDSHPVLG